VSDFIPLDPKHTDPKRIARERSKARELKKTSWWKQKISRGICDYCQKKVRTQDLTMDHIVPLARGGTSVKSNLAVSCKSCNQSKKLSTPVDLLFAQILSESPGSVDHQANPLPDPEPSHDLPAIKRIRGS